MRFMSRWSAEAAVDVVVSVGMRERTRRALFHAARVDGLVNLRISPYRLSDEEESSAL